MKCRFCATEATLTFVDLVNAPPSNAFLTAAQLHQAEPYFPLRVLVCEQCWLVQVEETRAFHEIFNAEYAYYSSYSHTWLKHCESYVERMASRLELGASSFVVEVASNDGYLLQYFVARGVPCLGIEPTAGTAAAARQKGIETREVFWGAEAAAALVGERGRADLMLGNNVLAHVPEINDFVEGFRVALAARGTLTFEFPHLLNLIRLNQFDTIYHEHYSYLSLGFVRDLLLAHGLIVYDVEELPTHGGSLRVYARHAGQDGLPAAPAVAGILEREKAAKLTERGGYAGMQRAADEIRGDLLTFLHEQRRAGRRVVAYGAAAKGNTLLNYCGIKGTALIEFVIDASPHKQGLYLPGSHIPIVHEREIHTRRPEFVIVLPWNIRDEITQQLAYVRSWGGRFVTCIPQLSID